MKKSVFLSILIILTGVFKLSSQSITSVTITGTPNVGSELTGNYIADAGTGNHFRFEWYTAPSNIILLTSVVTYTVQPVDAGTLIYFKLSILRDADNTLVMSLSSSNITINSFPVATVPVITGTTRVGEVLMADFSYGDPDGDMEAGSIYHWYRISTGSITDSVQIAGATNIFYKLTNAEYGNMVAFAVVPRASAGSNPGIRKSSGLTAVVDNNPPVATTGAITGSLNVGGALLGHYTYSDAEGDPESGSSYQWYSSPDGIDPYTPITNDTLLIHIIAMDEQGRYFKFSVTPRAAGGLSPGVQQLSTGIGPANSKPFAYNLSINGNFVIGDSVTAVYEYDDVNHDPQGASGFQWYREAAPIPGATFKKYRLTIDDVDSRMKFEVTPVSSTGYPDTGDPVMSSLSDTVRDNSPSMPSAIDVCISGTRSVDSVLTGSYKYISNGYEQKDSKFLWLRGSTVIKSGTALSNMSYTLKTEDIRKEIKFAVIPKNHRHPAQSGDTAFSQPLAIFTLPRESFSVADPDILLTANPSGGIFNGIGVTNGKFSPSKVNYINSPFDVTYQLTMINSSYSCVQNAKTKLYVTGVKMAIESFRDLYCQNGGLDTIYISNIPKGYTRKFLMTDTLGIYRIPNDSTIIIDPGRMSPGNKDDTLYFKADSAAGSINARSIKIFRPFIIDPITQVSVLNLPKDTVLCSNVAPFTLFVSQAGGEFTGPVVNWSLIPSLALGDTSVSYTYTTKAGCKSSVRVPFRVNPSPVVSFAAADYCIESKNDITQFKNKTSFTRISTSDSVNNYLWTFYDAGGSDTTSIYEPGYLYTTGGFHKISLRATTVNNCTSVKDSTIDLGVKPVADFLWEKECFHPNDSILLIDTTFSSSSIASRTWVFHGKDRINTRLPDKRLWHRKDSAGYLDVQYIVRTNYLNCHDTVEKKIYIRPTDTLSTDDYFENFEKGNGGWVEGYELNNTWTFGTPSRKIIKKAASGANAWVTSFTKDTVRSESVISPCFDFRTIQRPMMSLKLWRRFDYNRDGAALQYKIGDDPKGWQYVGTLEDGINWYNSAIIKGRPGGEQIGWTAGEGNIKDADWIESKHKLDELAGNVDVKFRIIYGSEGTSQDNDGLAFDDIRISSRTRDVLLEHFTNNSSQIASQATALVTGLSNRYAGDVINIQYHTNFPGSDPYYNDNPADASARFLFYGLSRAPYSIIDGGTRKYFDNIFDHYPVAKIESNDLTKRSLISPSFLITLNTDVTGGILTVTGNIKALDTIRSENVTLYIAVTEKISRRYTSPYDTVFSNVFRKFIPDAGGINLKKNWVPGDSVPITQKNWIIEKIPSYARIEVIAFIQNNLTKELYQAQASPDTSKIVAINDVFARNGIGFSLYPNPASGRLTVGFEKSLTSRTEIFIHDFKGTIVRTYRAIEGQSEFTISDMGLRSGIYLVRIKSGGADWGFKKLIISGN
jgi:hypothetical protein